MYPPEGVSPWTLRDLPKDHAHRVLRVADADSGLVAFIVLDDVTLGPAAGGVRTRAYAGGEAQALADARALARAMTLKCALSGLDAGGGKAVVLDHARLDRPRAFAALGEAIETLQGAFRTAGDVGTRPSDLQVMNASCSWVHTREASLAGAVARGLVASMRGALDALERPGLVGRLAAVQGAGSIGTAAVRALRAASVQVRVSDLDPERSATIAAQTGAAVCSPDAIFEAGADVLVPCALGGVVDPSLATTTDAVLICGGANNLLADADVERLLMDRQIGFVPDVISSAGAVIDGIGESVMGLPDRTPLIDRLERLAHGVVMEARETRRPTMEVAQSWARRRLAGTEHGR